MAHPKTSAALQPAADPRQVLRGEFIAEIDTLLNQLSDWDERRTNPDVMLLGVVLRLQQVRAKFKPEER